MTESINLFYDVKVGNALKTASQQISVSFRRATDELIVKYVVYKTFVCIKYVMSLCRRMQHNTTLCRVCSVLNTGIHILSSNKVNLFS